MALMGGLFVGGTAKLLENNSTSPSDIFWESVNKAQEMAIRTEHSVLMRYDAKEKKLRWAEDSGTPGSAALPPDASIQFLQSVKGGSSILIGGQAVETQERPSVTFYPDGTCDPFRVQIRLPSGASAMGVDPWTCAPVLEKKP